MTERAMPDLGRALGRAIVVALVALTLAPLAATEAHAARKRERTAAPPTPRRAEFVMEAESGRVLHALNEDVLNYPASLTKMMTLYLTFDALNAGRLRLDQQIPVSAFAASMPPTKIGLPPGATIEVESAILALVTKSANDMAVVLAEAIGGTEAEFARLMTQRAHQIGMTSTTFRNASGLPDPEQKSTARDLATLGRALIYSHGRYYHYFGRTEFSYRGVVHANHNRLMRRFDGMDGIKTGFIRASGFNLVASAARDGRRLIGVVMGGESAVARDNRMANIMEAAFDRRTPQDAPPSIARPSPIPTVPTANAATGAAQTRTAAPARTPGKPQANTPPKRPAAQPAQGTTGGTTGRKPQQATSGGTVAAAAPAGTSGIDHLARQVQEGDAGSDWAIQVGSFSTQLAGRKAADAAAHRLAGLLGDTEPSVVAVKTGKGTTYRARLVGVDERTARQACQQLSKAGQACVTIPPRSPGL
ncbi:MAG TPA: SPOR domain-containing protein [Azospirillaceae bacterium]|nr:SPOR domain-containing protein [Azospirillaceae bacterium]